MDASNGLDFDPVAVIHLSFDDLRFLTTSRFYSGLSNFHEYFLSISIILSMVSDLSTNSRVTIVGVDEEVMTGGSEKSYWAISEGPIDYEAGGGCKDIFCYDLR